jgi:hypothetical protein
LTGKSSAKPRLDFVNRLAPTGVKTRGRFADTFSGRKLMELARAGLTAVLLAGGLVSTAPARIPVTAQDTCLHGPGEKPEEASRRKQALGLTRQINTLQAQAFARGRAYLPLPQLGVKAPAPAGFVVLLSTDGTSGYNFSVVDETDPCRFGYFSSHPGLIYTGQAIR